MIEKFEKHILVRAAEQPLLECLREEVAFSNQQLKRILQNGAVWLETAHGIDRVRRVKKIIKPGETVHFYYDPKVQGETPPAAQLIADESDYSIWNKPGGMYSQGSRWGDHCTLYRWAEQHLSPQRPAFVVHRLDRAANGLMIIAHKKRVAAQFSKMFREHAIYKKYRARVEGVLADIELPFDISTPIDDKSAISSITTASVDVENQTTEVDVVIGSGRKHQIRKHLSGLGHPIVGDRLYGAKNIAQDLQLSSVRLEFNCPVTGQDKRYVLDAGNTNGSINNL